MWESTYNVIIYVIISPFSLFLSFPPYFTRKKKGMIYDVQSAMAYSFGRMKDVETIEEIMKKCLT